MRPKYHISSSLLSVLGAIHIVRKHKGGRGLCEKRIFAYKGEGVQAICMYAIAPMQKIVLVIAYLDLRTVFHCQHANIKNVFEFEDLER